MVIKRKLNKQVVLFTESSMALVRLNIVPM